MTIACFLALIWLIWDQLPKHQGGDEPGCCSLQEAADLQYDKFLRTVASPQCTFAGSRGLR
jgi:hypothetical protein